MTLPDDFDTDTADLEPISSASGHDALQRIMDTAAAAANAQAELEAQGIDPESPADEDDQPPEHPEADESTEQASPQAGAPEHPAEAAEEAPEPPEPAEAEEAEEVEEAEPKGEDVPRDSRRGRAWQRVQSDLDRERQQRQVLEGQLQQLRASDASVMQAIEQQAGSDQEYQALTQKVVSGRATDAEKQRVGVMYEWRRVAGPIYRRALDQVNAQMGSMWAGALEGAAGRDGMPEDARQQLFAAQPEGVVDLVYQAGHKAATDAAKAEAKKLQAEIGKLKAEMASLKTQKVATRPQPATPDGVGAPSGPKLPAMLLEDGTLNPEYEKLANAGKLYGVEKLTA